MVKRSGVQSGGMRSNVAKITAVHRQRRVLELRTTGMTFEEIARKVGYAGATGAYVAFKAALLATIQQPADEVRQLEVKRLDALLEGVWIAAAAGQLFAIDRALKIMERRAALLGLDAPQKVDIEARVRVMAEAQGLDPDEAVEDARRILREART